MTTITEDKILLVVEESQRWIDWVLLPEDEVGVWCDSLSSQRWERAGSYPDAETAKKAVEEYNRKIDEAELTYRRTAEEIAQNRRIG